MRSPEGLPHTITATYGHDGTYAFKELFVRLVEANARQKVVFRLDA